MPPVRSLLTEGRTPWASYKPMSSWALVVAGGNKKPTQGREELISFSLTKLNLARGLAKP